MNRIVNVTVLVPSGATTVSVVFDAPFDAAALYVGTTLQHATPGVSPVDYTVGEVTQDGCAINFPTAVPIAGYSISVTAIGPDAGAPSVPTTDLQVGSVALSNAAASASVVFAQAFDTVPIGLSVALATPTGAPVDCVVTELFPTGFTVEFSSPLATADYTLMWLASTTNTSLGVADRLSQYSFRQLLDFPTVRGILQERSLIPVVDLSGEYPRTGLVPLGRLQESLEALPQPSTPPPSASAVSQQFGTVALAQGDTTKTVSFAESFAPGVTPRLLPVVRNLYSGPTPDAKAIVAVMQTAGTHTGFTVKFSPAIPNSNYTLVFHAYA